MKGFKDFILRGNVAALAVAFVIGGAFGALVQGFVKDLVTPLIDIAGGGREFANATFTIGKGTFHYGDFVNLVVAFIVIAAVIYFVLVLPMEKLEARRAGPPAEATTRECPECLSKIPLAAHALRLLHRAGAPGRSRTDTVAGFKPAASAIGPRGRRERNPAASRSS